MFTLPTNWYKSSFPREEITVIHVTAEGGSPYNYGGAYETWDGSKEQDGTLICTRKGTEVIIDYVTENNILCYVEDRAFEGFLKLETLSWFKPVTIGDYAFCYTPNLKGFIDYYPKWLSSIGISAFRMSSFENIIDIHENSSIEISSIQNGGTREKRWGE